MLSYVVTRISSFFRGFKLILTSWRDRMLVRVSYTELEGISKFDEATNRTTRDLSFEGWGEFLVVWRRDNIEIYRDHVCRFFSIHFYGLTDTFFFVGHAWKRVGCGTQTSFLCHPSEIVYDSTFVVFIYRPDIRHYMCTNHYSVDRSISSDLQSRERGYEYLRIQTQKSVEGL